MLANLPTSGGFRRATERDGRSTRQFMVVAAELLQCLCDATLFPVLQRDEATLDTVENKLDGVAGDLLLDVRGKPVQRASQALAQGDQFGGFSIGQVTTAGPGRVYANVRSTPPQSSQAQS